MKNIFTKQIWVETPDMTMGTYKNVPKEWVEAVGSFIAVALIFGLMFFALIILRIFV